LQDVTVAKCIYYALLGDPMAPLPNAL
jgi:hypothetical protein